MMSREEFDNLIEPYKVRLEDLIDQVISEMNQQGIQLSDISFVELLGDTTRTPIF